MEKSIKLLIANENVEEQRSLTEKLTKDKVFSEIVVAGNGTEAIEAIGRDDFDILVCDLILSGADGFAVIEAAKEKDIKTKVIVLSALSSEAFIKKAEALSVDYYIPKPYNEDILVKRIEELSSRPTSAEGKMASKEIEERITNIFITVGIPAHIKGYQFLREAIKLAMENPDIINSITKKLYPSIAERFDTSPSKVERAIRHAIEVAWNRGKIENINSIFGLTVYSSNEKPTNGEFIALVADKMLLEN